MNESGFWSKVAKAFNASGHRIRKLHAGMFDDGTPDGIYVVGNEDRGYATGLLELKYVPNWPIREKTPVQCGTGKLTANQRAWIEDWNAAGGLADILLGVGEDWFVLRVTEVPPDSRIPRWVLTAARMTGRYGTLSDLKRLPEILARMGGISVY